MAISLSEIKTDYDPESRKYSFNQVTATSNGLIVEMDDTPENIRYHVFHPSGSFYEMQHLGNVVNKVVADNHLIIKGSQQTQIKGSDDKFIGGKQSVLVKNDSLEVIEKNSEKIILGDLTQKIGKKLTQIIGGSFLNSIAGTFTNYCYTYILRIGSKFQTKGDNAEGKRPGSFALFASDNIFMGAGVKLDSGGYPDTKSDGFFIEGYTGVIVAKSDNCYISTDLISFKSNENIGIRADQDIKIEAGGETKWKSNKGFEFTGNIKIIGKLVVTK